MKAASKHTTRPAVTVQPAQRRAHAPARRPQLELILCPARRTAAPPRPATPARAAWWFERMREVVDMACDWQPAPLPEPQES